MTTYRIIGATYDLKAKIKKAGGKWDSVAKAWTADLHKSDSIFRYDGRLTFTQVESDTVKPQAHDNGYCSKCQSYCFGDCQS